MMAHTSAVQSTRIVTKHATADSDQSTIARCEVYNFLLFFIFLLDARHFQLDPCISLSSVGVGGIIRGFNCLDHYWDHY